MDLSVSPSTRALLEKIERFVEGEILPREAALTGRGFYAIEPELNRLRDAVRAQGLWAPPVPRELGGMGLTLLEHARVSEILGRSPFAHYVFGCQAPDAGNIEVLALHGTPAQKEEYLRPLVRGEIRSCFAMTEPDSPGSNPTQLRCRARREGDDYVIDGHKWFTTGADGARFAIVMAVTDPAAAPHARATMILVPTATPGFRLLRNIPVMGQPGEGHLSHGEVRFDSCRVPQGNRLGPEGSGFLIAQERLGPGRIHHCMRWIGICERAFDLTCRRAVSRRIDESARLADQPIVQAWIAECRARIDAARLMVLSTAWKADRQGFPAAREEVSLIKFFVAEVMGEVVDRAVQVHGALGLTDDTPLAHYYAHERAARIYDGPDEVHKLAAARRILKRYATTSAAPGTLDGTEPVRAGEELDLERLTPYLRRTLDVAGGDVAVSQFPRGHSNLTYLVKIGEREVVLRRPPFGSKVKSAHDMGREFRVLSRLAPAGARVPRPLAYCEDTSILGAPFYLMERLAGVILRRRPPQGLELDAATVRRLGEAFVDTLVELHALDYRALGLGDFGNPEGYVERQVRGWAQRYQDARTHDIAEMETVAGWLSTHVPASPPPAVVHNDYKYDNLVLDPRDPTRILGILDWEMATIGDPLMDLGTALCYWVQADDPEPLRAARFGPTTLPGSFTRRELAQRYAEKSGRSLEHVVFYYCFGLYKTAVVVQQIYYRYRQGLTRDERFADLIQGVRVLAAQAAESHTRRGL
jgi:alkylation response protein AidB-like acyl-CoA dehydrogenase/aminoglycoside phosphotransferase (APT) family kinase protein